MPKFKVFVDTLNRDMLNDGGKFYVIDDIDHVLYNPFDTLLDTKITFKYLVSSLKVTVQNKDFGLMNNDGSFGSFSYTFKGIDKVELSHSTQIEMAIQFQNAFQEHLNSRY